MDDFKNHPLFIKNHPLDDTKGEIRMINQIVHLVQFSSDDIFGKNSPPPRGSAHLK